MREEIIRRTFRDKRKTPEQEDLIREISANGTFISSEILVFIFQKNSLGKLPYKNKKNRLLISGILRVCVFASEIRICYPFGR